MRMDDLVTMPPREITATSLVPPPTSTTMDPCASFTGIPAPIAAANGSSIVYAWRAPADSVASFTARSSTPVTPLGPRLADKVREHLLRDLEVGDHAVLQGPHGDDVAGRAPEHTLRRRAYGDDLIGLVVYCNHRGFRQHDPVPLHEHQRVRRAEIYSNVPPEQPSKHARSLLVGR